VAKNAWFNGKKLAGGNLSAAPEYKAATEAIVVPGEAIGDSNSVFAFENAARFAEWAAGSKVYAAFDEICLTTAKVASLMEAPDGTELKDSLVAASANLDKVTGAGFRVGLTAFYEHIDFGGKVLPWGGIPMPNLKPIGWNDKISSARVSGVVILFERTLFRGRKCVLAGVPYQEFPDLGELDFNDKASSISA
jgi:hypothetical protein